MEQDLIKRIVEAALLAANQPMNLAQLNALFPEEQPPAPGSIELALENLREDCAGRGIELVEVASGFRFQVRQDVYPWVARLWTERQTRYGRAVLETLALIAYRQPITRGEIEQIRGVAVSSNIIKTLEEREWIRVVGHRDVPGKPALFGTTKGFLDYFGLKSLDQLPPLTELQEIPDLEPELPFDGGPATASVAMPDTSANDDAPAELSQAPAASAGDGPEDAATTIATDAANDTAADSPPETPIDAVETTTVPSHPDTAEPVAEDAAEPEHEKQ